MTTQAHPAPTTQRIPGSTFAQVLLTTLIAAMQSQAKPPGAA